MPLSKSKSKAALQSNIKKEIKAGKEPKQAAAIAYSVQLEAKKKAKSWEDKKDPNEIRLVRIERNLEQLFFLVNKLTNDYKILNGLLDEYSNSIDETIRSTEEKYDLIVKLLNTIKVLQRSE